TARQHVVPPLEPYQRDLSSAGCHAFAEHAPAHCSCARVFAWLVACGISSPAAPMLSPCWFRVHSPSAGSAKASTGGAAAGSAAPPLHPWLQPAAPSGPRAVGSG